MERWLATQRNVCVCAVLGAITIAFSSILVRLSHASPSTAAIFRCVYAVPVLGLLAWLEDRRPHARHPASRNARRPSHPAAGPLFDATATAAVLCVIAGSIIGDARLVPSWPGAGWLITLALTSQVLGWLLITTSLPRLPAAMTSLLLIVQPVGSLVLAALVFGEAPSALQLVGVAFVLGALVWATRPRRPRTAHVRSRARAADAESII